MGLSSPVVSMMVVGNLHYLVDLGIWLLKLFWCFSPSEIAIGNYRGGARLVALVRASVGGWCGSVWAAKVQRREQRSSEA